MQMRINSCRSAMASAMAGLVLALTAPSAIGQQATVRPGNAANGQAIAMTWCSACHLVGPATGAASALADVPTFLALAKRLPTDADVLAAFIANPHPPMPNLGLSQIEIRDLLAYIATLR